MSNKTTSSNKYRGYDINTGKDNNLTCNTKTLDQIVDTVECMTKKHSKVLCTRVDIHSEQDSENIIGGKEMTRILENTKRNINSKFKNSPNKPDLHVIWTTEKTSEENNPHYHALFLVNGHAIRNGFTIYETVNKHVKKKLNTEKDGLVHYCESNQGNGIMINRNSEDFEQQKNDAVHAASYLAKTRSKEHNPKGSRVSSSSRLNKAKKK
ncbi:MULTISPECIES: YagK/YfjJ domain-containing protein [unclassified Desulfovibrio]|uniref:YagK/YfjJ domain-containing protein n=1 Tax=unclassified Desulfovibrio TaxID=2593640 RepID=UPI002FD993D7